MVHRSWTDVSTQESSSAAAETMTAEQKIQLTRIIQDAIRDCEMAIRANDDKKARDHDQAAATFRAEKEVLDMMLAHGVAHEGLYRRRLDFLNDKREDAVDDDLCKMKEKESAFLHKLCAFHRDAKSKYMKRKRSRSEEINNGHEAAQSAWRRQIASLERIAAIAKIDLEATRMSDALAAGKSFHEAQALWNSRARHVRSFNGMTNPLDHVVLRGGRGNFPMRHTEV